MSTYKILIEGYITFGILLSYAIAIIIGMLIGERQNEIERIKYGKKLQSNKKISEHERKFKIME